jgi:hypothetical protein
MRAALQEAQRVLPQGSDTCEHRHRQRNHMYSRYSTGIFNACAGAELLVLSCMQSGRALELLAGL